MIKKLLCLVLVLGMMFQMTSCYSAEQTESTFTVHYPSGINGTGELTVCYTDDYFTRTDGYQYNHLLARASLGLELASFTPNVLGDTVEDSRTEKERMANLLPALNQIGLTDVCSINYDVPLRDTGDKAAYVIAKKPLSDGTDLVAVVIRGGGYGGEWRSNFKVGNGDIHEGFGIPANEIYHNLEQYMEAHRLNRQKTKIWITGYSRGGAIGNIVAGKINENQLIDRTHLYAYLFAVPGGVHVEKNHAQHDMHRNIYNMVLPQDFVPKIVLPEWGFGRYGRTMIISNINQDPSVQTSVEQYFKQRYGRTYNLTEQQAADGDTALQSLFQTVGSQSDYVKQYQNIFMDLAEGVMCYASLSEFCDAKYQDQDRYEKAQSDVKTACDSLFGLLPKLGIPASDAYKEYLTAFGTIMYMNGAEEDFATFALMHAATLINLAPVLENAGKPTDAHHPEYYISWLSAVDDEWAYGWNLPDDGTVAVMRNGKRILFDQPPIIVENRTLVPMRKIFEALGAEVAWEEETRTAIAAKEGITLKISIGDNVLYRNNAPILLDVPAQLVNDRTLLPLRAVSEALDCRVDWNGNTHTAIICQ